MAGLLNITPQQVAKAKKPKRLTGNYYAGGKQGAFIEQVMPHALRFAEQTGLDPRLAIATAALETGWGKHAPGGALFGIKGSGQDLMTTEYVDGKPVQMKQSFRRYDAAQDPAAASFDDFSKLMAESKYYGGVRATAGKPFEDQLAAFVASPYATNPKADRLDALRSIGSRIYVPDVAMSQVSQEPAMQHDVPLEQQDWVHRPALDTGEGYKPGLLQSAFNAALGISNAYGQEQQEPQTMAQRKSPWQQRIEFLEQAERDRKQNAGGLLDAAQQPIVLDMPAATPAASPAAGAGILQGLNPDITQEQINAQLGYPQPGEPIPMRELASYDVALPQPVPLQQAPAQAATAPIEAQAAMMQHPQLPPAQQPQNGLQRYAQGLLGNQAALGLVGGGLLQAFGAKPQEAQQFGGQLAQTLTQQRERQQQRDAVAALVRQAGGSEQDIALAYASPQVALDMLQKRQAASAKGPDLPTSVREYNYAVSQGYDKPFEVWKTEVARSGATQINMGKLTEGEANAAGFADRLQRANTVLVQPSGSEGEALDLQGLRSGQQALTWLPGGNLVMAPEFQLYEQSKRDFINAVLRKESGAAINKSEFESADKQYFPQPGDNMDVVEAKRKSRDIALDAMARSAGVQYRQEFEQKKQPPQTTGFEGWSMQEVVQ